MGYFTTVLIVDDDEISNFLAQRIFQKGKYCSEFIVGRNGEEGIDILMNRLSAGLDIPDLILIDLNMPVLAGPEFLGFLLKKGFPFEKSTIIVVSNLIREDIKPELLAMGVSGFLTKPLTMQKVIEIMDKKRGDTGLINL